MQGAQPVVRKGHSTCEGIQPPCLMRKFIGRKRSPWVFQDMSRPSITGNCVFKWTLLQSGWAKEPASSWLRRFTALGQRFAHLSGKAMAMPAEGPLASEGLRSQVSRSPVSSPSPQYVFFCSSWPQSEAQLPAHSFLGQIEERTLRVQRPSPPRPGLLGKSPDVC